jgi:hypothetical protein
MSALAHPPGGSWWAESRFDSAARRALRNVSDADEATQTARRLRRTADGVAARVARSNDHIDRASDDPRISERGGIRQDPPHHTRNARADRDLTTVEQQPTVRLAGLLMSRLGREERT